MDRKLILLIPLASLIIACMTCNSTTTAPSTSTGGETAAPAANGTGAGDIQLYSDSGGDAGNPIDTFPTTQHKLHFKTKVDALSKGQKIRWVFTALAAGDMTNKQISVLKLDIPLDGVTTLDASLSNDTDWPSGNYKVELYVDDSLLKSGEFLITQQ